MTIEIPPLARASGRLPLLASHMLERIASERGTAPVAIDDGAMAVSSATRWPETCASSRTRCSAFRCSPVSAPSAPADRVRSRLRRTLIPAREAAKVALSLKVRGEGSSFARRSQRGRRCASAAGSLLGVSRATLYRKLREHDL
jgi:transcriptional regulator of acetoin/glycerol metabolism